MYKYVCMKTRIGAKFLKLIDKNFLNTHPLHQIINRNTIKMAYRTTPNFKRIISSHNTKLTKEEQPDLPCNCRKKNPCQLEGKCRAKNVIYQTTVTTQQTPPQIETYIGMTANEFKLRISNHKKSFKRAKYINETTLSQHIWKLKNEKTKYKIKWKILARSKPYNPITGVCNLCTLEKFYILFKSELGTLNKKEEIFNHCRHKRKLLLDNT